MALIARDEAGYVPVDGPRPLKRVTQHELQDRLAGMLLERAPLGGDRVTVPATTEGPAIHLNSRLAAAP